MLLTLCESEPHRLADIFAPGLPLVQLLQFQLERLIERLMPKLAAHFKAHGIAPSMFSAQWLLTIFTYSFSFSVTCRIWDCFLLEGWKVVFRFSIALLRHHEAALLKMDMEGILTFMHVIHEGLEADALVEAAFRVKLKRKHLLELRKEYEAERGPVISPVRRMKSFSARKANIIQSLAGAAGASAGGSSMLSSGDSVESGAAASATGDNTGTGVFKGAHSDSDAATPYNSAAAHDPGHAPSRKLSVVEDIDAVLIPGSPAVAAHTAQARRDSAAELSPMQLAEPVNAPSPGNDDSPSPRRRASVRSLLARSVPDTLEDDPPSTQ